MKFKIISILLLHVVMAAISSCNGQSNTKAKKDLSDATLKDTIAKKPDVEPSKSSIISDLLNSYKDTIKIDTTYIINRKDTMAIKFRHLCTYDNKIVLPERYLKIYDIEKLQTHNFVSSLEVKLNSRVIFKGMIRKEDFQSLLDDELKRYGVLSSPNLRFVNNSFSIQYSISVPLSDVGKGVTVMIDTIGSKHIAND